MDEHTREHRELTSPPLFRVWMCGPFRVEQQIDGAYIPLPTTAWGGYQVTRQLLKVLLCAPQRQARREALLERLWPDEPFSQATLNLNTATGKLRKALHSLGGSESLLGTQDDGRLYQLAGQSQLWVDVDEALALLAEVERLGRHTPAALPLLQRALTSLNRGTLLEEEEGAWAAGRRATLLRTRYRACFWLVESSVEQGCLGRAETLLNTLLEEDPTDEDALSRLMMLLHQQGMTHQALRLYEQACAIFATEQMQMSEGTATLATQLKQEQGGGLKIQKEKMRLPSTVSFVDHETQYSIQNQTIIKTHDEIVARPSVVQWKAEDNLEAQPSSDPGGEMTSFDPSRRLLNTQALQLLSSAVSTATISFLDPDIWDRLCKSFEQPSAFDQRVVDALQRFLEVCWDLCDRGNMVLAEHLLTALLPHISSVATTHKGAARLVAEGLRLQSILSAHQLKITEKLTLCLQSVKYARMAQEPNTLASSLHELTAAFRYAHQPEKLSIIFQEALFLCEQLSPSIRAGIYAGSAVAFAQQKREKEADFYIHLAYETLTKHPQQTTSTVAEVDNGFAHVAEYEGVMYLTRAQPQKADTVFEQFTSLSSAQKIPERNRLELLNYQGKAAIGMKNVEKYAFCLEQCLEGAIHLNSKKRGEEALEIFTRDMPVQWLQEPRIRHIVERFSLFSHVI